MINNIERFSGKYIATESFQSRDVIAYGNNLEEVYNSALKKGVKDPVINYVPKKGAICIY